MRFQMLLDDELVKSNLRNVTRQIKHLLDTTLNPAPTELMMKVKNVVEDYKRDLQAKADYIEKCVLSRNPHFSYCFKVGYR